MAGSMEIRAKERSTCPTRRRWSPQVLMAVVLGVVILLAAGGAGSLADERAAFVNLHRCEIAERLTRIEATATPDGKNRFIVIALEERGQSYVQCLFHEDGASLLCEASSGYYGPAEGEAGHLILTGSEIAALGALGFDTSVSDGNFRRMLIFSDGADFEAIATFLLKALYDGYGARERSQLEIFAPVARRPGAAPCTPVG